MKFKFYEIAIVCSSEEEYLKIIEDRFHDSRYLSEFGGFESFCNNYRLYLVGEGESYAHICALIMVDSERTGLLQFVSRKEHPNGYFGCEVAGAELESAIFQDDITISGDKLNYLMSRFKHMNYELEGELPPY